MDECGHSKARCRMILSSEGEWRVEGMSQEEFLALFPNIEISVSEGEIRVRNLYAQEACQDSGHPSGDTQFVLSSSLVGKGVLSVEPGKSSQVTGWRVESNSEDFIMLYSTLSDESFAELEPPSLLQSIQALRNDETKLAAIRAPFSESHLSQIEALAQSDLGIAIASIRFSLALDDPLPDSSHLSRIANLLEQLDQERSVISFGVGHCLFFTFEKSGDCTLWVTPENCPVDTPMRWRSAIASPH